jgi:hypothetical protein
MALRVARGLFRLWLVLSVLWIGGVGVVIWRTFPEEELPSICDLPANERSEDWDCSWLAWVKEHTVYMEKKQRAAAESGMLLALIPPAFLLALGSALVWAVRGFR